LSRKQGYRERLRDKSDGTDPYDLESTPVPAGMLRIIEQVSAENETSAFTELRLYVKRGADLRPFFEEEAVAADELIECSKQVYLYENERLLARFAGTTSGDLLNVEIFGFEKEVS